MKLFKDEIPKIPRAAYEDLDVDISEFNVGSPVTRNSVALSAPSFVQTSLTPLFSQPGSEPNFNQKLLSKNVQLENAFMESSTSIFGILRVVNLSFHKVVRVRWTLNNWVTVSETLCDYVQGSSCFNTDKFSFTLQIGCLPLGARLQFCIKFECEGQEYWDNNNGTNYVFQVSPDQVRLTLTFRIIKTNKGLKIGLKRMILSKIERVG